MKIFQRAICFGIAAALALPVATRASAQGGIDTIELLSHATGMTVHEVELALGPSANYEQPVRYASANRRFRQAVGRTLYEQITGEGELSAQQVRDLIATAQTRQARQTVAADRRP